MELEKAIKTAIEYEKRIRDLYKDAVGKVEDPSGKYVLKLLEKDELDHIAYLEHKLEQWRSTGELSDITLNSTVPPKDVIDQEIRKLEPRMSEADRNDEIQILSHALTVEKETSAFYKQMVDQLSGKARQMFARFLEIEDDHIAAVQAELDYLMKTGYWFDMKEFDMEDY